MVKPAITAFDPGSTPDPAQPVPALPSNTGAGATQPMPVTGDPSGDKNLAPPPEPVPQNNGGVADPSTASGSTPTPTTKGVDPQQGADSKPNVPAPAAPAAQPPARPDIPPDNPPAVNSPAAKLSIADSPANNALTSNPPATDPPANNPPADNSPNNNIPANNRPTSNDPGANLATSNPTASPAINLQFGSGKQNVDPNNVSPAQLSQLHQALAPSAIPATNPSPQPGAVELTSEPQVSSGGTSPANDRNPSQPAGSNSGEQSQPVIAGPNPSPPPVANGSPPSRAGDSNSGQSSQPVVAGADPQQNTGQPPETPDQPIGGSSSGALSPAPPGAAHIVLGPSTLQVPQPTAQPAPSVAGKPVIDVGGGGFQVEKQTLSPGGATANVASIPVHVNAQGAPVVGTQTYQLPATAATTAIGSHTIVANTAGIAVNGQQIQSNAAPVDIGGTPVQIQGPAADKIPASGSSPSPGSNLGPGNSSASGSNPASGNNPALINNALQLPQGSSPPVTTIAGVPVVDNQGTYHVQGTPLAPGSAIAIEGTTCSLGSQGASTGPSLNVGGKVYNFAQVTPSPVITVAGQAVQAVGPSAVAINGQTVSEGAPAITLSSSIPIVFGASNLVIGTSTIPIAPQNQAPPSPVLNVPGGQALTQVANTPNAFMIAGSTIAPGSSAAVVSGTTYSLAPFGSLIIGSSTILLATASASAGGNGALSAGNQVFTPMEGGTAVAIGGSILSVNGPAATDHGTVISFASDGLIVGSSTYAFATPAPNAATTTQEVPITTALEVAGQSFTSNASAFSSNRTTISAGGPGVNVSGRLVSSDSGGNLVLGTSTVPLESTGIGAATTTPSTFVGSAMRAKAPFLAVLAGMLVCATYQLL